MPRCGLPAAAPLPVADVWSTGFFGTIGTYDPDVADEIWAAEVAFSAERAAKAVGCEEESGRCPGKDSGGGTASSCCGAGSAEGGGGRARGVTYVPAAIVSDRVWEAEVAYYARRAARAVNGEEESGKWTGKENGGRAASSGHGAGSAEGGGGGAAAAEDAAGTRYFNLCHADSLALATDPLFTRFEDRLLEAGLSLDDLPPHVEAAELTEIFKELGFSSAVERAKLKKALRERREWSLAAVDSMEQDFTACPEPKKKKSPSKKAYV